MAVDSDKEKSTQIRWIFLFKRRVGRVKEDFVVTALHKNKTRLYEDN